MSERSQEAASDGAGTVELRLFTKSQLEERYLDLYQAASRHCDRYNREAGDGIAISFDEATLLRVVWSAYDDIARYKLYHLADGLDDKSDAVKRAAYLAKWIVRLRPIVIAGPKGGLSPEAMKSSDSMLANEHFALRMGLNVLLAEGVPDFELTDEAHFHLLYDFGYRELSGDALVATFQQLAHAARGSLFSYRSADNREDDPEG